MTPLSHPLLYLVTPAQRPKAIIWRKKGSQFPGQLKLAQFNSRWVSIMETVFHYCIWKGSSHRTRADLQLSPAVNKEMPGRENPLRRHLCWVRVTPSTRDRWSLAFPVALINAASFLKQMEQSWEQGLHAVWCQVDRCSWRANIHKVPDYSSQQENQGGMNCEQAEVFTVPTA